MKTASVNGEWQTSAWRPAVISTCLPLLCVPSATWSLMYVFLPHFMTSFHAETVVLRTDQTARGEGISPPCGSVQASLLDRTRTPSSPESERGKGNTSYSHPLGDVRARTEAGPSVPTFSVLRGKSGHDFGVMECQASRQPVEQLFPGAASTPSTRPIKVAQRCSIFLVKILSPGGRQEMIHSLSQPMYTKARY